MLRFFSFLLFAICLASCTTYNFYQTEAPTYVYQKPDDNHSIETLPFNELIVIKGKKKAYNFIDHNGVSGYILTDKLRYTGKATKYAYEYARIEKPEIYSNQTTVSTQKDSLQIKYRSSKPVQSSSSSGGQVQVKGYTRKDGTYVKPHTRSAPRKKG